MVGGIKWNISCKALSTVPGIFNPKKMLINIIFMLFIFLSTDNLID